MILLDARMVGPRPHGIARYALGLVPALQRLRGTNDPRLTALVARGLPGDSPLRTIKTVESNIPLYSAREQVLLPPILRRLEPDLVHSLTYAAPLAAGIPVMPTIHDLIHLRFPEHHGAKHRLYYAHVVGPIARRAPRVITVSEASADAISERLRVARERIVVTPLGVEERFLAAGDEEARRVRALHRLPGEFLLYVGNDRPHKNAAGALRIRELIAAEHRIDIPLVVVGAAATEIPIRSRSGSVIGLLDPSDADLPGLYRASCALVMPSLDEGFGLPALEAMAAGTPVVAARRGGLPEVVGDGGLLEDPRDEGTFAATVARVLEDATLAGSLRSRGRDRAARFTWEETARRTLDTYRAMLEDVEDGA